MDCRKKAIRSDREVHEYSRSSSMIDVHIDPIPTYGSTQTLQILIDTTEYMLMLPICVVIVYCKIYGGDASHVKVNKKRNKIWEKIH